jgi:hypothetical protein
MLPDKRRVTYDSITDINEDAYMRVPSLSLNDIDGGSGTIHEEVEIDETSPPATQDLTENGHGGGGPSLHDAQSIGVDSTQRSNRTRRVLEPQHPDCDPVSSMPFTPTERRLSGMTRVPKQTGARPFNKIGGALRPSRSTPNLATIQSPKHSNSSGYRSGAASPEYQSINGSEYGYYTIKELMTPRPLNMHRLSQTSQNTSEIPDQCFYGKEVKLLADEEYSSNSKRRKTLFVTHYYLNSVLYMKSFEIIFADKIGASLGFTRALDSATAQGPKILCDITQTNHDSKPIKIRHEIFPTLKSADWPEQADGWKTRKRKVTPTSMPGVQYRWPSEDMMEDLKNFGCHLLPVGYMPTRGKNGEQFMEWQLAFPEAERYLEARLTHTQFRCFLFTMALYKTFLEPLNIHQGLLPTHIRTLLFWQCERGHSKWPEDRQGNILRKFLDAMYDAIKHMRLDDYFIEKRNLFESTPRTHLLKVQEKLLRIRENPVMHMLIALRNLRYTDSAFYPVLDYKKLYDIITRDNQTSNPRPQQSITPNTNQIQQPPEDEESDEEPDSNTDLWKGLNINDREKQWKKDVRTQIERERATQIIKSKTRAAAPKHRAMPKDSIDIKV